VDDTPYRGDEEQNVFKELAVQYDAPAYIRRARQVQQTLDRILERCRKQREEWLGVVRTRVGLLHALAGDWPALRPWLTDEQLSVVRQLYTTLEPRLRARIEPTTSARALRRALDALIESVERFNRRWREFMPTVELKEVNELRDGYNRYYLLEKECAVRSPHVARQGFRKLEPLTVADLFEHLPLLPVPLITR
jgi:hypothetical protein